MTVQDPVPLEALLEHSGWARSLARQLARDDDSAEELVQRTWVAALERPPEAAAGGAATLRRWIASVMRNFARQEAREQDRRRAREAQVARPERVSDAALEGIEGQRRLLEALRSLPEPYRGTLYARYFEGLAPRRIAREEGAPVKTVKSRLARGLALLRERLDRDHGGNRAAWMAWILPMTAKSATPTALIGALIVDSKLKVAGGLAALVCVLAIGVQSLRSGSARESDDRALAVTAPAALPEPVQTAPATTPESGERVSVAEPARADPHAKLALPEAAVATLRGRVLDLENRPVGGVRVVFADALRVASHAHDAEPLGNASSDARGYFELPTKRRHLNALVEDPRWVTVYKAYVPEVIEREVTIFVAPRRALSGVVVDPDQRPVEGAEVEVRPGAAIKRNLERRLDSAYRENFIAKSDADGRFTLENAPACEAEVWASAPGWLPGKVPAPELSKSDLVIVLGAREQAPAVVRGIVVDEAGKPIEGAHVGVGGLTKTTESDGRFTLDLDSQGHGEVFERGVDDVYRTKYPRTTLRAVKPGLLPREELLPPLDELRAEPAPREYVLVLAGRPLTIRGEVVDADGRAVANAAVTLLDESPFGPIYRRVGEAAVAMEASLEELARGGLGFRDAGSGRDGRFVLTGLSARSYDLAALDPATLRYAVVKSVQAGSTDARIVLPSHASLVHVAGRVVSRSGEGLPNIKLHVGRLAQGDEPPEFVKNLRTDEEGRFDLGSIEAERFCIQVLGEEIFLLMAWQPPEGAALDQLEIAVSRRCPVKVELTPTAPRADGFAFLDAAGNPTQNLQFEGPMMSLPLECEIVDGVSEAFATEDTARTLVLYKEHAEVARQPVHLVPGELTILRP